MSTTLVEYYQILGSESRPVPTSTVSVVSNRTITLTPPSSSTNGSSAVTEAVIIQAQVFGYTCLWTTVTTTSTLYLTPTTLAIYGISAPITTQTFSQTTTTTWENYTETVGNTTCIYINSHYNATEPPGCPVPPPCV